MTNDERASLEVLRVEMNGKLDLLIERTGVLKKDLEDHEMRLRHVEDAAVPAALTAARQSSELATGLEDVKKRMWMAVGALGALSFAINVSLAFYR